MLSQLVGFWFACRLLPSPLASGVPALLLIPVLRIFTNLHFTGLLILNECPGLFKVCMRGSAQRCNRKGVGGCKRQRKEAASIHRLNLCQPSTSHLSFLPMSLQRRVKFVFLACRNPSPVPLTTPLFPTRPPRSRACVSFTLQTQAYNTH